MEKVNNRNVNRSLIYSMVTGVLVVVNMCMPPQVPIPAAIHPLFELLVQHGLFYLIDSKPWKLNFFLVMAKLAKNTCLF